MNARPSSARSFPSFRLFRDQRKRWRWRYDLRAEEPIAVSADAYDSRAECERMVEILRSAINAPLWVATPDLTDG